jgi:ParB family protein of integrating conjugative element (PFGI_1 class)
VSGEALQKGIAGSDAAAPASRPSGRHVSIEERRRLVAESLRVGNPGNNSRELPTQADPRHDCQIELTVDDIRPYENNPRRAGNARFSEIKESIRSSGIRNPLTVTRRPGDEHFIVEAGGNTRLLAVQQLWAETRDARFQKVVVLFRPWRSESHVLTSHLIENELRGEMTFWDKATGVVALKARLEVEKGHALSLRQLEDELKRLGLAVNTATLGHYLFATERLRTLGEAVADLSGLDVKTMQPRLNAMKRYAQTRTTLAEADLYAKVFEPVFQNAADQYRQSQAFSASEVCKACEDTLARRLAEPVAQVRLALDSPTRSPQASPETLPARRSADRPIQPAAMPPAAGGDPSQSESGVGTANPGAVVSGRPVESGNALASNDAKPIVLSRIIEQVRLFAGLAGIDDCLRLHPPAPLGYYMDPLPVPDGEESPPPSRRQVWWLLALVAGQLDRSAPVDVTEGSTEPGANDGGGRVPGDSPNAFPFDAAFFGWLVDGNDATSTALWNLLGLLRESRASIPSLRGLDRPMAAAGDA